MFEFLAKFLKKWWWVLMDPRKNGTFREDMRQLKPSYHAF